MRWMRSTWPRRWAVAWMIAGLLSLLATPQMSATRSTEAHASWLQAHVEDVSSNAQAAVDAALADASDAAPPRLDAFVDAFVASYTQAVTEGRTPVPLAELFALSRPADAVDGPTLVRMLLDRAHQVGRTAVLPRLTLAASGPSGTTSGRATGLAAATPVLPPVTFRLPADVRQDIGRTLSRHLLRTLISAQPLGP